VSSAGCLGLYSIHLLKVAIIQAIGRETARGVTGIAWLHAGNFNFSIVEWFNTVCDRGPVL
jgi:hypothetical protein